MREKLGHDLGDKETTSAPSFFEIDPQSWPDLPPVPIKPKRPRNSYNPLGVVRFTDQPLQYGLRLGSIPPGWRIPQSKLVEQLTFEGSSGEQTVDEQENAEEGTMRRVRLRAKELMLKLQSGEVERGQVLLFYKNNATDFISHRTYESYRDYAIKRKLKIMSWPEYAREVILERFSQDFYAFRRRS